MCAPQSVLSIMNFVIPKKKRLIEKLEIDVSLLEPKATIEDVSQDSSKFTSVKNIVMESTSDRQTHQFMHVEKVQLIRNRLLEYKYDQFRANLRLVGQSDVESYEFLLIGFDPEDSQYIADNGYTVGTAFHGDLGVYLYRYVDLVTPSLFYKDQLMRVMIFKTLRGKCYPVGLGSTELEPTLECSSHVAASDHIPSTKKSRQQLYRQSAVYHYEYNKDMSLAEVPSGVLPYAMVDLRFSLSESSQHSSIPPSLGYVHDQLHFYPVYEGHLTICSSNYEKTTLCTIFEDSNKPHGLDESLIFTKLLKWPDVYDMKGIAQLMTPEVWGLIAKQREVCVKNPNEKSDKWRFRYASHFVWVCNEARFATMVNAMRVEQCAAVSYSIDATTYVAFPSSQFSNVFGLPWLQTPSLHVLVIHANPLFYADPIDLNSFSDETEITSKIPLGTAILDGDDASLCRFFSASGQMNGSSYGQDPFPSSIVTPYEDSPLQNTEQISNTTDDSCCLNDDADSDQFTPLPPIPLPPSAGKSCLRSKPPQVFVDNPPLIGKSVPPPAPGSLRNSNENKCGKKLSNDRDEAVKAGLHGRALKDHAAENIISSSNEKQVSNFPTCDGKGSPSNVGAKTKDLFQGVFSTIAKGGNADADVASTLHEEPIVHVINEPLKNTTLPRRAGQTKNCIITSLPLPLMNRIMDDELTICDMEIESGSEDTLTPPAIKPSPERSDEVIDFIDDHDEDYDAQFKCESSGLWNDDATCSSQPGSTSLSKQRESTTTTNQLIKPNDLTAEFTKEEAEEPVKNYGSVEMEISSETSDAITPSAAPVSEMPENVVRLLELLRSNESTNLSRDTDLRKQPAAATSVVNAESNRQRKSRFDQPPPELTDHTGFVPKPVPTASIGFVGHVPALGSSIMDTDLRSHPPHTLAFSIKKAMPTPTLNPPATLLFGDDEDDDVNEPDDQRLSDRKDRDERRERDEKKDREDKKEHDDRGRRWDRFPAVRTLFLFLLHQS
ncbi:hypothetical protein DICVIV_08198 [Dictyocaulus viviparus]|uniref:TASOR pseudo-PARP domain-containing protein n=1 Tax=Dictyocaulus viviparus TaxID=29172 RepID=A0A0D8XPV0_DICVI|nr:hypothetical protein DICVIV_08198 [Dictyocaulus viviparus]